MNKFLKLFLLVSVGLLCALPGRAQHNAGMILNDVPKNIDVEAHYLFYLHGRIVEQGRRPTSPEYGVYEYDQILNTFQQYGFVVISEQRKKDTNLERYAAKVAKQVKRLVQAGVPPQHITIAGASQGSRIAMFVSTYLKNRDVNFVIIAGCSEGNGYLNRVNLHGNVLSIYERSDVAKSCYKFRADATGLGDYKEIELNTGLRHGFVYRPMKEWIEPTAAWAQGH
jgi:hypothetical protein